MIEFMWLSSLLVAAISICYTADVVVGKVCAFFTPKQKEDKRKVLYCLLDGRVKYISSRSLEDIKYFAIAHDEQEAYQKGIQKHEESPLADMIWGEFKLQKPFGKFELDRLRIDLPPVLKSEQFGF